MIRILAAVVPAAIAAVGLAAAVHVPPPRGHHEQCADVVLSQRTATGHEADLPVRICGGMRAGNWQCFVQPWGPLRADAKLECSRQP